MPASINPTALNFNFLQFQPDPLPQIATAFHPLGGGSNGNPQNIVLLNVPYWLNVSNLYFDAPNNVITATFTINTVVALQLSEGEHLVDVRFRANYHNSTGWFTYTFEPLRITLNVQHTQLLELSPGIMSFEYIIGESLPQNQTLQIQSDGIWNLIASQSWVQLSATTGSNNGQVFIGVNPETLPVGNYSALVDAADNLSTEQVVINLLVSDGNTLSNYLYTSPESLQFITELGQVNNTVQTVTIESSHDWTLVSSSWIVVSADSGDAGITSLNISVAGVSFPNNAMSAIGEITIMANGMQTTVYVELILVEFFTQGLEAGGFYFADDRNTFEATNILPNTYLQIDATAFNTINNYIYHQQAPYQNGLAKLVFGLEANNLIITPPTSNNLTSRIQNYLSPLTVNYTVLNNNTTSQVAALLGVFQNIKILRGKTPIVPNKLCYVPNEITLPINGLLSLSVLALEEAPTLITITGDIETTFTTSIANDLYVYNAIINLNELALEEGQQITVGFADLEIVVNLDDISAETTYIAFSNEWEEFEVFTAKGFVTKSPTVTKTTTDVQIDGESITQVIAVKNKQAFSIDTGWIYTDEERIWLSRILDSKRIFIMVNNEFIPVILETKQLQTYKTREHYKSYLLKFKSAKV